MVREGIGGDAICVAIQFGLTMMIIASRDD